MECVWGPSPWQPWPRRQCNPHQQPDVRLLHGPIYPVFTGLCSGLSLELVRVPTGRPASSTAVAPVTEVPCIWWWHFLSQLSLRQTVLKKHRRSGQRQGLSASVVTNYPYRGRAMDRWYQSISLLELQCAVGRRPTWSPTQSGFNGDEIVFGLPTSGPTPPTQGDRDERPRAQPTAIQDQDRSHSPTPAAVHR